jgi:hypothetical protein
MQRPQRDPGDDASPEFWAGSKVAETPQALLWQCLNDDPPCPSRRVRHALADPQVPLAGTLRHSKRVRKAWGLTRGKGRPRRAGAQKTIGVAGKAGRGYAPSVMRRCACVCPWARPPACLGAGGGSAHAGGPGL